MASSYSAPIGATQVGSYFVQQYYQVLQQQPDYVHQFYTDASCIVRVDGDSSESASALMQIHTLIMSMNFSGIKVKTINSLDSWNGGVLVVVSGTVKPKDFSGWRNFVQTFFLAPQEKGYFVLNDVFHFANEEGIEVTPAAVVSHNNFDAQPTASEHLAELPVHDYALEAEAAEYVDSVHIKGNDADEEYSYQEHNHDHLSEPEPEGDPEPEPESESEPELPEETHLEEETAQIRSFQEETALTNNVVEVVPEPEPAAEEPVGDPSKPISYASILRASKGRPAPSIRVQPSYTKSATPVFERQPPVEQSKYIPPAAPETSVDLANEGLSQEGELKSVYVRNLPSTISTLDILQEFNNFGKIKQDGVFLRNRTDVGVCYAFVEFEEVQGVENAIKASPIQLAGRQVYIEERRPSSSSTSRGGGRSGRGRGRGGRLGGRTFGRGSYSDDRVKSNGYRGI